MGEDAVIDANFDLFFDPSDFEPFFETDAVVDLAAKAGAGAATGAGSSRLVPLLVPPTYYSLAKGIDDNRRINDALIDAAKRLGGHAAGVAEPKFGDLAAKELRRIKTAGAVGHVLSPRAQGLFGNDWQMVDICEAAADCGLLNIIRSAPYSVNESLARIWHLAGSCPDARFLVLGAFESWENIQVVRMAHGGPENVWYELSGLTEDHDLASLTSDVGPARLVFGSGNPASRRTILDLIARCGAADGDKRAMLYGNAASLIGGTQRGDPA